MKLSHATILVVLLLGLNSCKKDLGLMAGGDACEDFSLTNGFGTNSLLEADVQHRHPCFNPNNGNEVVYVYTNREQGISQLRKHNLVTDDWEVLVEKPLGTAGQILGPPSWGSNGWVLYHTIGWDTWKVKDDGTGLVQLTFTGKSQWPIWNNSATLFNSGSVYDIYSLIRNDIGQVVDTILIEDNGQLSGALRSDWSLDNRICTINGSCADKDANVIYFEYGVHGITHLKSPNTALCSTGGGVTDIEWSSGEAPSELYFTMSNGFYKIDIAKDEICRFMDFCTSIGYETFSIAPEGGYMLATRLTTRVIDTEAWTIEFDRDIYRIDLTTFKETKVNLP